MGQGADRQRRKDNDPLQAFDAAAPGAARGEDGAHATMEEEEEDYEEEGDERGAEAEEDRIYQSTEGLGESTAGRVRWKQAHKKGKFNKYGGKKPEKKKFRQLH